MSGYNFGMLKNTDKINAYKIAVIKTINSIGIDNYIYRMQNDTKNIFLEIRKELSWLDKLPTKYEFSDDEEILVEQVERELNILI